MADDAQAYFDFQKYVWGRLPIRKYLCGHERVLDVIAVVVQEWPVEAIDHSKSGDTEEVVALEELSKSCKRHLALTLGEKGWEMWQAALTPIIWQCMWAVLHWYRIQESNAEVLFRWRSKWRSRKKGK